MRVVLLPWGFAPWGGSFSVVGGSNFQTVDQSNVIRLLSGGAHLVLIRVDCIYKGNEFMMCTA